MIYTEDVIYNWTRVSTSNWVNRNRCEVVCQCYLNGLYGSNLWLISGVMLPLTSYWWRPFGIFKWIENIFPKYSSTFIENRCLINYVMNLIFKVSLKYRYLFFNFRKYIDFTAFSKKRVPDAPFGIGRTLRRTAQFYYNCVIISNALLLVN